MRWYLPIMAAAFTLIFIGTLVIELAGLRPDMNPALLLLSSGLLAAITWVRVFLARRSPPAEGEG